VNIDALETFRGVSLMGTGQEKVRKTWNSSRNHRSAGHENNKRTVSGKGKKRGMPRTESGQPGRGQKLGKRKKVAMKTSLKMNPSR